MAMIGVSPSPADGSDGRERSNPRSPELPGRPAGRSIVRVTANGQQLRAASGDPSTADPTMTGSADAAQSAGDAGSGSPDPAYSPGGVQLWSGDPNNPANTQVMGAGVSVAQNPTGLSLQWIVGGDEPISLTHTLTAIGLAATPFDGVNIVLAVSPAAGGASSSGSGSGVAATSQPTTAHAPATVPSPVSNYHITDIGFAASNPADFHAISRDDGTGPYLGTWHDGNGDGKIDYVAGDHDDPVCYTRSGAADGGISYILTPKIKVTGSLGTNYQIRAIDLFDGQTLAQGAAAVDAGSIPSPEPWTRITAGGS